MFQYGYRQYPIITNSIGDFADIPVNPAHCFPVRAVFPKQAEGFDDIVNAGLTLISYGT